MEISKVPSVSGTDSAAANLSPQTLQIGTVEEKKRSEAYTVYRFPSSLNNRTDLPKNKNKLTNNPGKSC